MTDFGIIFSKPMVLALREGTKHQTRRMISSPLAKARPGDRLWVREATRFWSDGHDAEITFVADDSVRQTGPNTGEIPDASLPGYFKRVDRSVKLGRAFGTPSIHMPRWLSRMTLIVERTRRQRLHDITSYDCRDEGLQFTVPPGELPAFRGSDDLPWRTHSRPAFEDLWRSLHDAPVPVRDDEGKIIGHAPNPARWDANPEIVAIRFSVIPRNIDRLTP